MSHSNITCPDIYSAEYSLREQLAIENAKRVLAEIYRDQAIRNLESVFERVKNNDEVWLCYPDGEIIHIGRVPDPARS